MDDDPWNWTCQIVAIWLQETFPWGHKRASKFIGWYRDCVSAKSKDEYIDGEVLLIGNFSSICGNILKFGERVKLENEISHLRLKSTKYSEYAGLSCSSFPVIERLDVPQVKPYTVPHLSTTKISLVTSYDRDSEEKSVSVNASPNSEEVMIDGCLSPQSERGNTPHTSGSHCLVFTSDGLSQTPVPNADNDTFPGCKASAATHSVVYDKRRISQSNSDSFYMPKALSLNSIFFEKAEPHSDNFIVRGLQTHIGCKLGVQKFMKDFLSNSPGTRIEYKCRGKFRRVVVSPYSRKYIKPHVPLCVKVFDQIDNQVRVFQTSIDRLNIPPEQLTCRQMGASGSRTFDSMPLIVNRQMDYDDLLKWEDMDDDTEVDFDDLGSEADLITLREIEKEVAEREKKSSSARLSDEHIDEIIALERSSFEEKWKVKVLPKLLSKAHNIWLKTRSKRIFLLYQSSREAELLKLQQSLFRVVKEIKSLKWSTSLQVKRICSSFHSLLDQMLYAKWVLEVIHSEEPGVVNLRTGSQKRSVENGTKSIDGMDDQSNFDMGDFIIEDEASDISTDKWPSRVSDDENIQITQDEIADDSIQSSDTVKNDTTVHPWKVSSVNEQEQGSPSQDSDGVESAHVTKWSKVDFSSQSPRIQTVRRRVKSTKGNKTTKKRKIPNGVINISDDDLIELPSEPSPGSPQVEEVIVISDSDEYHISSAESRLRTICQDNLFSTQPNLVKSLLNLLGHVTCQDAFDIVVEVARSKMGQTLRCCRKIDSLDDDTRKNYNLLLGLYAMFVLPPQSVKKKYLSANDLALISNFEKFQLLYQTIPKVADSLNMTDFASNSMKNWNKKFGLFPCKLMSRGHNSSEASQVEYPKVNKPRRRKHHKVAVDRAGQSARKELQRELEVMNDRERIQVGKANSGSCIINLGHNEDEGNIEVNPYISRHLKEHQIQGIQFLWKQVFLSKRQRGCLLAHTMGLGKTLQIIAFLFTLAEAIYVSNPSLPAYIRRKFLILCPPSLCQNWLGEFHKWTPEYSQHLPLQTLIEWDTNGGVLLMSYHAFRNLLVPKYPGGVAPLGEQECAEIHRTLLKPGPSLVVADEAHVLKNEKTLLRTCADMFDTRRRIALTGSPLSNSLREYYHMIDWIDKNFLGNYKEFNANTITPIIEGLFTDSTPAEILLSQKRLHQLGKVIESKVHSNDMPSKYEFIIKLALSPVQYDYLVAYSKYVQVQKNGTSVGLLARMHDLQLICSHPLCFMQALRRRENKEMEQLQKRQDQVFLEGKCPEQGGSEDFEMVTQWDFGTPPCLDYEWARDLQGQVSDITVREHGVKCIALVAILKACQKFKEKALVFSHCLETLDYIENILTVEDINSLRLDGKTKMAIRQQQTCHFNSDDTTAYLISAKAGSIGLNLQGATRVVLFDLTFNPQFDEQAVGRAYRLGQTKPVYVYRLHTVGTFEERLFGKNIHKLGLSSRVVDKKNPKRNVDRKTLSDCFRAPPNEVPAIEFDIPLEARKDAVIMDTLNEISIHVRGIITTDTFESPDENLLSDLDRAEAEAEAQKQQEVLASLGFLEENENLVQLSHNTVEI